MKKLSKNPKEKISISLTVEQAEHIAALYRLSALYNDDNEEDMWIGFAEMIEDQIDASLFMPGTEESR